VWDWEGIVTLFWLVVIVMAGMIYVFSEL